MLNRLAFFSVSDDIAEAPGADPLLILVHCSKATWRLSILLVATKLAQQEPLRRFDFHARTRYVVTCSEMID